MAESQLKVTIAPQGANGLSTLVFSQEDQVIYTDKVDLSSGAERAEVVARACKKFSALDPNAVLCALEQQSLALVDSPQNKPPPPPSGESVAPYRPFPVHTLPPPVHDLVVVGAQAIGCDPSYIALPALTAMAAAIGNARRLRIKRGWNVPPILWTAVVGESGTAKTPAFTFALRAIRNRQRRALEAYSQAMEAYERHHDRWEQDCKSWSKGKQEHGPPSEPARPVAERSVVSDATVESLAPILLTNYRGLLMARDELAGWIGSFDRYAKGKGGSDAAHWLTVHTAQPLIVDRKTGVPATIFVPQASICVCGGIQPDILQRALSREHRESGLAARLLIAHPPRKPKVWTEADNDPMVEASYAAAIDELFELRFMIGDENDYQPLVIDMSPEAKSLWTAFYDQHAQEQAEMTGDLSYAWSKLEEYAARLALVLYYARWAGGDERLNNAGPLDAASMAAGIELCEWFKHEASRFYATIDETDEERDQRRLVEWIQRKEGRVFVRDVQAGCRWLRDPGIAESALNQLAMRGLGAWESVATSDKGGRPTRRFCLKTPDPCQHNHGILGESEGFVDVDSQVNLEVDPASGQCGTPDRGTPLELSNRC